MLFGLVVLGSGVIAWKVRFRFLRVTLIQALERIYYRLPHYQNQLRIENLEAQLSLLENNFQAQLQQQIEERQKSWRSQYSTELQQLQNQIQHIESELGNLQIEERVNSLFANHSEVIQQQLENSLNRWRSQYSTDFQQLQNQIQHIGNKPVVLQSEWRNTKEVLER